METLIGELAAIPARIRRATDGWSAERLRAPFAPGAWSAADILAHLRASDAIVAYRMYAILTRDNPPLPAFDERRWAEIAGYTEDDPVFALQAFTLRRAELIQLLRRSALSDWQRTGTHEVNGAMSLLDTAERLLAHEQEHCIQLEAIGADRHTP